MDNSCSSAHHYSDVDTEQFTSEIITNTISEAPYAPVDEIYSTTLTPYFDLKRPRAVPIPAVYSGIQNNDLMVEDPQRIDAIDPSITQVSASPTYANVGLPCQ